MYPSTSPHTLGTSSRPPRQPSKGLPDTGVRKAANKSERSKSRAFALQALYQVIVGKNTVADVDVFTRDLTGFSKADAAHFEVLLHGCAEQALALDTLIVPTLDRTLTHISPVEHAVMWIGAYELQHCPDIPWRVVLNECIELAKEFGGTDGHKYVNGVLNVLARQLRMAEVHSDEQRHAA